MYHAKKLPNGRLMAPMNKHTRSFRNIVKISKWQILLSFVRLTCFFDRKYLLLISNLLLDFDRTHLKLKYQCTLLAAIATNARCSLFRFASNIVDNDDDNWL